MNRCRPCWLFPATESGWTTPAAKTCDWKSRAAPILLGLIAAVHQSPIPLHPIRGRTEDRVDGRSIGKIVDCPPVRPRVGDLFEVKSQVVV